MDEPLTPADQPDGPHAWAGYLAGLRAQVRRDRRGTSIPLLILGAGATAAVAPAMVAPTSAWDAPPGAWLASAIVVVAFAVLWLVFWRRAARAGVGHPGGFGAAAALGLLLIVPGVIVVRFAGPFLVFGLGLLIAGRWQHSRFLTGWALATGAIGVLEGFYGISNRLPPTPGGHRWVHPAVYLALALATVLAGVLTHIRENRAS